MAPKKRATKKAAPRKKRVTKKRSTARKKTAVGGFTKFLKLCALVCVLLTLALGLTYYFGSYTVRGKMEQSASSLLNSIRSSVEWPDFVEVGLDTLYDAVPHSEGLIVDGGELGHDGSPLLAGVPTSDQPVRLLNNKTSVNVFSPSLQASLCLAYHLTGETAHSASVSRQAYEDPRIPQLRASQLSSGKWTASPLAPPQFLAAEFGQTGSNEAMLSTQLSPMRQDFATGVWQELSQELYVNYPKRFGEVWVYTGPIYTRDSLILPSKLKVPVQYYAIAFDLTDAGGLRAIAFIVPKNASDPQLDTYLSSIGAIEAATGFNFMPDMEFDARETLRKWVSPQLW